MTEYVAFLRGVNVGGRVIKMAELKTCFEAGGFKGVKTYLQSGNVLFESDLSEAELKESIEKLLTKTFNYPAKVQIFSIENLKDVIDAFPFEGREGYHSYVIFIENGLEKELANEYSGHDENLEKVAAGKGVVYWQVERGLTLKSSFGKLLSKAKYRDFNTNRNLNTLKKIA